MATQQRKTLSAALVQPQQTAEDVAEVAGPAVAALPTGIPEHDALSSMLAELAGSASAKVTVYRVSKNGPMAYVFACAPDAFSLDDLRDEYGGGDFRLFISKNGQLYRNILVSVERSSDGPAVAATSSRPHDNSIEALAAAMRDGFARQAEALREVAAMRAAAPASPFAGLDLPAVITALATLLPALRPLPVPVARDNEGSINMLLKGIELARELRESGGGGEEPSMLGVLRDVIKSPMLAQAVAATMQPPVRQNPTVRLGAPTGGGAVASAPVLAAPQQSFARETPLQPVTDDPAMMQAMLKQYLGVLCAKAAADADPMLYADVVLDNMPDEMLEKLLAEQPTPVDALIRLHPDVALHRDWFGLLVGTVAEAYNAPPEEGGEGSDDASQHAAPVSIGQSAVG